MQNVWAAIKNNVRSLSRSIDLLDRKMDKQQPIILSDRERRSAHRSPAIMALQDTDVHVESALQHDSSDVIAADVTNAMKNKTSEVRLHEDSIDDLS